MPSSLTAVQPGTISPRRPVPSSIARPEYVDRPAPAPYTGPEVKDTETIERMRVAGRIAAQAMAAAASVVAPGVTTDEVDRVGHEFLLDHGAYPSTLGYRGFPKSLCTSVNEVVCHGIPDDRRLEDGDIVNIDITAYLVLDGIGVHGDTDATYPVGDVDEESRLLVERTHEAMMRGIKAVRPGRRINVIGRVIESYARRFGYGVVRDFTGHGIGTAFHSGLVVPHYDAAPRYDTVIEPGMTFTIEPMLNLGTHEWEMWDDGWTVVTKDRRRSAQFEHTLLVTDSGAEILTLACPAPTGAVERRRRRPAPPSVERRRPVPTDPERLSPDAFPPHHTLEDDDVQLAQHPAARMSGQIALGVDVGGSGIKGATVDLTTGELTQDRLRIETPQPAPREAVPGAVAEVVSHFRGELGDGPVGVTIPGVVTEGVVRTAANIDPSWIGTDIDAMLTEQLGRPVHVVNDADAAGVAEARFGGARDTRGLVLVTTLGTGIGTALLLDGKLVPNSELGHLEIDGHDAESRAANSTREDEELSWTQWAARLQRYYGVVEDLLWPSLIVVGGGVSKKADRFLPLLHLRAPIVPATLRNQAGIVGAALLAHEEKRA